jgi:hypothetical protein
MTARKTAVEAKSDHGRQRCRNYGAGDFQAPGVSARRQAAPMISRERARYMARNPLLSIDSRESAQ